MKRRNTFIGVALLSLLLAVLALDLLAAFLPVIIPDTETGERMAVAEALGEHSGQLLVLLVSIGSAAVALRQQGGHVFDPDEKDDDKP